jgi:hypothetical protein
MREIINEVSPYLFTDDEVNQIYDFLIEHFGYSIKDINCYEELTTEEKSMISKELFERITA